jgi:hypothetical protein
LFSGAEAVRRLQVLFVLMVLSMRMLFVSVRMPMTSQDEEPENIRSQAETAYDEDELGIVDLGWVDEARKGFEEDRYA